MGSKAPGGDVEVMFADGQSLHAAWTTCALQATGRQYLGALAIRPSEGHELDDDLGVRFAQAETFFLSIRERSAPHGQDDDVTGHMRSSGSNWLMQCRVLTASGSERGFAVLFESL